MILQVSVYRNTGKVLCPCMMTWIQTSSVANLTFNLLMLSLNSQKKKKWNDITFKVKLTLKLTNF